MENHEVGQTIRDLRRAKGWAQLDLALLLRVSPSTVHKWEAGKSQPQLQQFKEMAALFGVAMDDIEIPEGPRARRRRETRAAEDHSPLHTPRRSPGS
jgi:transcriptional regulator with XRE-family HTH domain